MLTYLLTFLISAAVSFLLTPLVRQVALARQWMDQPDGDRKVHQRPVPRVGGIAIAAAFFVPLAAILVVGDHHVTRALLARPEQLVGLVVGAIGMVLLGFVDDLKGLGAKQKFAVQFLLATVAYMAGFQIAKVANPFGDPILLHALSFPVTVIWIVGIVNAINLIDGLDGLATGISLFSVATLFVLTLVYPNYLAGITAVALAGALAGFIRYNFNPATIFMGDSGSLFVGYILATTSIMSSTKSSTAVALVIPILALGVPIMDTSMALLRRFLGGRPLFKGDREHIHHRLLALGFTHQQVVLLLYAACAASGIVALAMVWATRSQAAFLLALVGVGTIGVSRSLGYLDLRRMSQAVRYGLLRQPRLRGTLEEFEQAGLAIRHAPTIDDALQHLIAVGRASSVDALECELALSSMRGVKRYHARFTEARTAEVTAPHNRVVTVPVDWALGDIEIQGSIDFRWACPRDTLQLPEAPCYQWLALLVRDRALELARDEALEPRLRLTSASDATKGSI